MNLDELGDLMKKAKSMLDEKMNQLTEVEKRKVENIVKGVDKTDTDALKDKIDELNKEQDA